jgi:MHS family proline/betaine transporter-like MFS transporter
MIRSGRTLSMTIERTDWQVILRASLGGALEFYDFVIYGMFAQYIGAAFFPAHDPLVSLMASFAVFGVGYLARPLGGVILGHFGDRYGRRRVFIVTILGMSCATLGIGLLPDFAHWGYAAPACMILLRMIQGFCLGGELPGAITYVVETVPRQAGFAGGIIFFCVNSGVGLASLLSLLVYTFLQHDEVVHWGWRIGFLFGAVCGLLSFWLRLSLEETAGFKLQHHTSVALPVADVLRSYPAQVLVGVGALAASGGFNGLLFSAAPFFSQVMHYSAREAIVAQNIALALISVGLLTVAWISDQIPRRHLLAAGGALLLLLAYPFYSAADARTVDLRALFIGAGLVASLFHGAFAGVAADLFPTRIRFSGIALVLNISFTLFSGLAPVLSTVLVAATGSTTGPAWFAMFCGLATMSAGLVLKKYDGQILAELASPVPRAMTPSVAPPTEG